MTRKAQGLQPPRLDALAAMAGLLSLNKRFDLLSVEDPRPGLSEIIMIVRNLGHKLKEMAPPHLSSSRVEPVAQDAPLNDPARSQL